MITGVAIRGESILITLPKPNRHSDCFAMAEKLGIDCLKDRVGVAAKDQGFVTHTGKFLDRVQTAKYLKRVKQDTVVPIRSIAISEDLW